MLAIRAEGERLHGVFMGMTQKLLTGDLEVSLYEDQVRALLGTNSFELFTLDKLLNKLLSHMRIMVQVGGHTWDVSEATSSTVLISPQCGGGGGVRKDPCSIDYLTVGFYQLISL